MAIVSLGYQIYVTFVNAMAIIGSRDIMDSGEIGFGNRHKKIIRRMRLF